MGEENRIKVQTEYLATKGIEGSARAVKATITKERLIGSLILFLTLITVIVAVWVVIHT